MPRKLALDSEGYWDAYGPLRQSAYVPLLSTVGLARAMGRPASDVALRAYCYLASHSQRGVWLKEQGEREQYGALRDFIEGGPLRFWLGDECLQPPKGYEDAEPVDQMAACITVASATYEQIGAMFPEYSENSRPITASKAVKRLVDAEVIGRVYEGHRGRASLYAFLPIVFTDPNGATRHVWAHGFELSDYDADSEAMGRMAGDGWTRPAWPWPDS